MKIIRTKSKVMFIAAICISLFGTFIPANAKDNINKIEAKEKLEIKKWLKENEVNDKKIDKLINKLEKGEKLDSFNPDNPHKKIEKKDKSGLHIKEIYEDGSFISYGIDLSEATVVTYDNNNLSLVKALGGGSVDTSTGSVHNGSGYTSYINVKVYRYESVIRAHFYADFAISSYGGEISRYDKQFVQGKMPVTIDSVNFKKGLVNDYYGDPFVSLNWNSGLDVGGSILSEKNYLKLIVGPKGYSVESKYYY